MAYNLWSELIKQLSDKSTAIVIGIFDIDGRLVYANSGMNALLGTDQGNQTPVAYLINPNFNRLIDYPACDEPVFDGLLTAGNGMDISRTVIAKVYRRNDRLLIFGEYDVMELDYLNRQLTEFNQEINNLRRQLIKEKKVLEKTLEKLKETQVMLIHSEKMSAIGKLVAGIAHEINNPMAYVASNLHSLKNSFSDIITAYSELENLIENQKNNNFSDQVHGIRKAHDIDFILEDFEDLHKGLMGGVNRVSKIVQDLRTFSRLQESEIKEVDISESVGSTLELAQYELKKRNIKVRVELSDLPPVECYSSELNQVFLNLMINAAQAMEKGGILDIRGRAENGNICLEFADTGVGIPDEIMNKIFDPFFTTKPVGSGTGLGLSISYKIITEKHKGTISVRSKVNEGTVFTIIIPRRIKA